MKKKFNYDLFNYKFRYQKERANATLKTIKSIEKFFQNNPQLIIDVEISNLLISDLKDCAYNNRPLDIIPTLNSLIPEIKTNEYNLVQPSCALIYDINRLIFQSYYLNSPAGLLKNIILPKECLVILEEIYVNNFKIPCSIGAKLALKYFNNHHIGNNHTDKFI